MIAILLFVMIINAVEQFQNITYQMTNDSFNYLHHFILDQEKVSQMQDNIFIIRDLSKYKKVPINLNISFVQESIDSPDKMQIQYYISLFDSQSIDSIQQLDNRQFILSGQLDYIENMTRITNYNLLDDFKNKPIVGIKIFSYKQQFSDEHKLESKMTVNMIIMTKPIELTKDEIYMLEGMELQEYKYYANLEQNKEYEFNIALHQKDLEIKAELICDDVEVAFDSDYSNFEQVQQIELTNPIVDHSNRSYLLNVLPLQNENCKYHVIRFDLKRKREEYKESEQIIQIQFQQKHRQENHQVLIATLVVVGLITITMIALIINKLRKKDENKFLEDSDVDSDTY